jgi:hypothetical protein
MKNLLAVVPGIFVGIILLALVLGVIPWIIEAIDATQQYHQSRVAEHLEVPR